MPRSQIIFCNNAPHHYDVKLQVKETFLRDDMTMYSIMRIKDECIYANNAKNIECVTQPLHMQNATKRP